MEKFNVDLCAGLCEARLRDLFENTGRQGPATGYPVAVRSRYAGGRCACLCRCHGAFETDGYGAYRRHDAGRERNRHAAGSARLQPAGAGGLGWSRAGRADRLFESASGVARSLCPHTLGSQWSEGKRFVARGLRRVGPGAGSLPGLVFCRLRQWSGQGRQGAVSAADVCQCGPDPAGQDAGAISERRASAASVRHLEAGGTGYRYPGD